MSAPHQLPTPSQSSSSGSSSSYEQALKRRRVQNDSSSDDALQVPPQSQVAREGYTSQKFRVGGPPLQILPLETTLIPHNHEVAVVLRELVPRIENALSFHQVERDVEDPVAFVYRTIPEQMPAMENMTAYVPATWNDSAPIQWLKAVDAIRAILVRDHRTRPIKVEIIAWQLTTPRNTEALEEDHPVVAAWPEIRPQVHNILGETTIVRESWLTIIVLRRGYNPPWSDIDGSPHPSVVLLIIMDYVINPWQWRAAEHKIRNLLTAHGLTDVEVEFERGENTIMTFPVREPTIAPKDVDIIKGPYNVSVGMGADFGPARYFDSAPGQPIAGPTGTIGGYFTVVRSDGKRKKMGITNYHVVREVLQGFNYTTSPTGEAIRGEVPDNSELDDEETDPESVQEGQAMLAEYQEEFDEKKQFFDENKQILGRPWMSSGFTRRTSYNGRLDWALIDFTDNTRIGSNMIPPKSNWPNPEQAPFISGRLVQGIASVKDSKARKT
ncbi:MAG: hypothetical protein LQ338_004927, partial [Usnochroma carphineum]